MNPSPEEIKNQVKNCFHKYYVQGIEGQVEEQAKKMIRLVVETETFCNSSRGVYNDRKSLIKIKAYVQDIRDEFKFSSEITEIVVKQLIEQKIIHWFKKSHQKKWPDFLLNPKSSIGLKILPGGPDAKRQALIKASWANEVVADQRLIRVNPWRVNHDSDRKHQDLTIENHLLGA